MESSVVQRKLAAIFSADVKGYSRLMGEDEVATIRTLTAYRETMTTLIRQHRGRVVDSPGDNMLAEFGSVVDAVQSAVAIQNELQTRNATLSDSRKMEFRIGINVGDIIVEGERIYGDGVNIAARLESLAEPGGICVSSVVYDQVENKLADLNLRYEHLGEQIVKNIAKPVTAYRISIEPQTPTPSLSSSPSPVRPFASSSLTSHFSVLTALDKPSIAVLPFTNLSGDAEQEYFSDGITEDLLTDLSKLSGLFVISRNSVFLYKGKAVKPEQIGKELGARYMLEGSVRKAANRVRVTAQLIDTSTGYHLWAERYDRELEDIFAVQDEVTQKIVAALQITLTTGERSRLGRPPTTNLEAYEYFLRGLETFARRTPEANALARQMFERAIELDPRFAAAYARLGRVYMVERAFQWSDDPQLPERAAALAQQAIALDDALPGAHQTLAYVYLLTRQFDLAIAEARQAVALDPNDADACVTLGEILSCAGEPQKAVDLVEKALRLDPHNPPSYLFSLGQA
ncbi:MAG: adenylate/guanylate cyclase domain-containing protein [Candidatus Binatia bacterium]